MAAEKVQISVVVDDAASLPIKRIAGNLDDLGGSAQTAGKTAASGIDKVGAAAASAEKGVGKSSDGMMSSIGGVIAKLGLLALATGAIVKTGSLLKSALSSGLDRLTTIQDATMALTVQMGDAKSAADLLGEVTKVVQGTPFSLSAFADAAKNLVSFGVGAKEIPGLLTAIADSAAASGQGAAGAESMVQTFGKMAAAGKIDLGAVWELSDKGVPALQILANHFGLTTDAMRDMISKGSVPAGEGIAALVKGIEEGSDGAAGATVKFGGVAQSLGQTFSGSLANMRTGFARFGASILGPWLDDFTAGFTKITELSDKAGARLKVWSTDLEATLKPAVQAAWSTLMTGDFTGAAAGIGEEDSPLVRSLLFAHRTATEVGPGLQGAWQLLMTGDFTGLGMGLGEEDSPLVSALLMLREWGLGIWDKFRGLWDTLKDTAIALAPPLLAIAESLLNATASVSESSLSPMTMFAGLMDTLAGILTDQLVPVIDWLSQLMTDNQGVVTALVGAVVLYKGAVMAAAVATEAWTWATAAWTAVTKAANTLHLIFGTRMIATNIAIAWGITMHYAAAISTGVWTAATWLLNAALAVLTSPITWIIVAIAALVAGFIWAYQNVDWFKNGIQFLWDVLQNVWTWIKDNAHLVTDAFVWLWEKAQPVVEFLKRGFEAIKEILQGVLDFVVGVFTGDWSRAWEGIKGIFKGVWDWVSNIITGALDILKGIGGKLVEWGGELLGWIWDGIQAGASVVLGWGASLIGWIWDGIKTGASNAWSVVEPIFNWIGDAVEAVGGFFSALWDVVVEVWDGITKQISWAWNNHISPIIKWLSDALVVVGGWFTWLWDRVSDAWTWIVDKLNTAWNWIQDNVFAPFVYGLTVIGGWFTWLWETVQNVWTWIVDKLNTAWNWIRDNVFSPLGTGITSVGNFFVWLWETVQNVWTWIVDKLNTAWNWIRDFVFNLLNAGITAVGNFFTWLWETVQNVWTWIVDKLTTAWNWIRDSVFNLLNAGITGVGNFFTWLWETVQNVWTWIVDKLTTAWNWVRDNVFSPLNTGIAAVGQFFSDLWTTVQTVWDNIGAKVSDIWNNTIQPIWTSIQSFIAGVGDFFAGILAGVSDAAVAVVKKIGEIKDAIASFLGIGGSSTVNPDGSVSVKNPGATSAVPFVFGNAEGGFISGPGTGTSDSIPSYLSDGEFVVKEKETRKNRPLLEAINAGRYADGGIVGVGHDVAYNLIISKAGPMLDAYLAEKTTPVGGGGLGGPWPEGARGAFLAAVASQMGTAYEWGADSPPTFDCSGLMSWGLRQAGGGFTGRLTAQGFNETYPHISTAKAGDLVTFDTGRLGSGQAGHIGVVSNPAAGLMMNTDGSGPAAVADYLRRDGGPLSILDPIGGAVTYAKVMAGGDPGGAYTPSAGVEQWRSTALQALAMAGESSAWINDLLRQMNQESSGNPTIAAVDSNSRAGHPSIGLMQVILSSFNDALAAFPALRAKGQTDPLANILAGIIYTRNKFGSLGYWAQNNFGPYDTGGVWPSGTGGYNTSGRDELVLGPDLTASIKAGGGSGGKNVTVAAGAVQITVNGSMTSTDRARLQREVEDAMRAALMSDMERAF